MQTMKGPGLFLAQFVGTDAPFDSWDAITAWAARCGYLGVQVPSGAGALLDLDRAAQSRGYCDELAGQAAANGVAITELSAHVQGQLVAVHPAYDEMFDGFAPTALRGKPQGASGMGGRSGHQDHRRLGQSGIGPDGGVFRRAGLALSLSVAAAPRRSGRGGLRRTGRAVASDPGPCRQPRRRHLLRDPSRRRPA